MTQEFYGPVDQVAGRDIVNQSEATLWHCETSELRPELKRCRGKLWQARLNLFLNVPAVWMIAGLLVGVWLLSSGQLFKQDGQILMLGWAVGGVVIPSLWLAQIRNSEGHAISFYRGRISIIKLILRDRA